MRLIRLYQDLDNLYTGATITLSEPANHRLINVLRVKPQQSIEIFNTNHQCFLGVITKITKKTVHVLLKSTKKDSLESTLKIHLALGISKNDRMTLALEKAIELGVNQITPLITDYCDLKLNQQLIKKKQQQWQQTIIQATEQSGRCVLAKLHPPIPFQQFIQNQSSSNILKLFFEPTSRESINHNTLPQDISQLLCLIGPVGGWSMQEINQLHQNNYLGLNLGPRILRFETATTAGLAVLQFLSNNE